MSTAKSPTIKRIPVLDITPQVSGNIRPVKAVVNETLTVGATVFREGHDSVAAEVVLVNPEGIDVSRTLMTSIGEGTDRFEATITPTSMGHWSYRVEAWSDVIDTWLHRAHIKVPAGIDADVEIAEGVLILERIAKVAFPADAKVLKATLKKVADKKLSAEERLHIIDAPEVAEVLRNNPVRELISVYGPIDLQVERERALYGSWYEFFPRSEGAVKNPDGSWKSGTFASAALRLPAVAAMGFDVLYLPPIHPIGVAFRKGPNNTLTPGPHDPGSPWAIGSAAGGHDAIHPDLGTEKDFTTFVATANKLGIEIALDLALQASPDHPWVKSHPEWFTTRADGTIAYAENPPKKYQDIYPINFDNDPEGIFIEVKRVVQHWIALGVNIFRVDNPHTKPVSFWERLIGEINEEHPQVIFLAEAFTRPAMMRALGEVGFQQSYTYFTWRNEKHEIEDYLRELSGPASAYMRPNFFANTPDILPEFLQYGGPNAFAIRAALAATSSPTWGIYAGYELYEHVPVKPRSEEYLDSEKYQYRPRDWEGTAKRGATLAPFITKLNHIRRAHPALQQLRNITFHNIESDSMLCFSKRSGDDLIIVVMTLDPTTPREAAVHLNMPALGMDWQDQFTVREELSGAEWNWSEHNFVRLDPHESCVHILSVRQGTV